MTMHSALIYKLTESDVFLVIIEVANCEDGLSVLQHNADADIKGILKETTS